MPNKIKKLISWDCPSILYILRNTLLIGQLWHKWRFIIILIIPRKLASGGQSDRLDCIFSILKGVSCISCALLQ